MRVSAIGNRQRLKVSRTWQLGNHRDFWEWISQLVCWRWNGVISLWHNHLGCLSLLSNHSLATDCVKFSSFSISLGLISRFLLLISLYIIQHPHPKVLHPEAPGRWEPVSPSSLVHFFISCVVPHKLLLDHFFDQASRPGFDPSTSPPPPKAVSYKLCILRLSFLSLIFQSETWGKILVFT